MRKSAIPDLSCQPRQPATSEKLVTAFFLDGTCFEVLVSNGASSPAGTVGQLTVGGQLFLIREVDTMSDLPVARLTRREREIALLIADGKPTKQIAYVLGISPHTANTYVNRIRAKLGARNRPEMVAAFFGALYPGTHGS
jgi:DNA-binding CsgD family transcriptional regulator